MIRAAKMAGLGLCVLLAAYLVVRALVEIVTVNPGDPQSYHDSWGGPHYAGVLAVHCIPGIVGGAFLIWLWRRVRARRESTALTA